MDKDLLINLDKTKVMVFNTTQACEIRPETEFFLGEEKWHTHDSEHA